MKPQLLAFALVAALASSAFADNDLSGDYTASGVGVDGKMYESPLVIKRVGDTYTIEWKFADHSLFGTAIRSGDVMAIAWMNDGKAAVCLYKINGRTLEGQWADGSGNGKLYAEKISPR